MHFLLVGPGALGCLLSSVVSKGLSPNDQFTILDYDGDRAGLLNKQGVTYVQGEESRTIPVNALSDPEDVTPVDVIFLCVKSYDVRNSLEFCRPLLTDNTLLIFLQNGISHLDAGDHLGNTPAAFATTTEGANLRGIGHVHHAGRGVTFLGFLDPPQQQHSQLLDSAHRVLVMGGLQVEVTNNILARLWAKLFVNTGINALTAYLNCTNGELLTIPGVKKRMERAVFEALHVAKATEIQIMNDPFRASQIVCQKTRDNISSMLQDVRNQRRTEIEAINGAIVELGKRYGVATPENSLLCSQIREIEATFTSINDPI